MNSEKTDYDMEISFKASLKLFERSIEGIKVFILVAFLTILFSPLDVYPQDEGGNRDENDEVEELGSCALEIIEIDEVVVIEYDPFAAGVESERVNFTLSNESDLDCQLSLLVSLQDSLPSFEYEFPDTGVEIELRILEDQIGLERTVNEGSFDVFLGVGESREFSLSAVIIQDAMADANDHVLNLDFSVLDSLNPANPLPKWDVDLVLRSLPRAQVNLSGTIGAYGKVGTLASVDFGIAKKDATRLIYVQLRANTVANLEIKSENKGVLIHKEEPEEAPPIKYFATLGEEDLDLTKTYNKTFELPKTYEGRSFPLTLTLGDPKGAMAGRYSDTIIFEFSPL